MLFTINIDRFYPTHRLNKSGEFVDLEKRKSQEIDPEDMVFNSFHAASLYKSKMGEYVTVEGEQIACNTDESDLVGPIITINVHRTRKPKQKYFSREEINELLAKGNDDVHNSLVIDLDGFPHLVRPSDINREMFAVVYEAFGAGNGYIGHYWEKDRLEDLYESLLQGWHIHLCSSDTEFVQYNDGTKAAESIKAIEEILNK